MMRQGTSVRLAAWIAAALLVRSDAGLARADEWKLAEGPLLTKWTREAGPNHALPEYPRPQMVRQRWQNLNGVWDYAVTIKVDPDVIRAAATGTQTAEAQESVSKKPPFTYQNPLSFSYPYFDGTRERTITELRDPAVIREGDRYYLTFTAFPFTHSTSRDPGKIDYNSPPGIMLYSSPDLKSWKFEKWLVKSSGLPADCPYKHRFWAPEIHKIRGEFYLIFTADNWIKDEYNKGGKIGNYVAFVGVSDNVTGPYRHITWLKGAGCDTTLFGDDDGKTYAVMPFGNEYIQEVDLGNIEKGDIRLLGQRRLIVSKDNSDVGKKTSPGYMEGPWMTKRNGKYVLFTAAPYKAGTDLAGGYWVGAAKADSIWGPYTKEPQVFPGGHVAVFQDPDGRQWLSYRGESGGKAQGRLCIDPVPFNADGSVKPFKPSTERVTIK